MYGSDNTVTNNIVTGNYYGIYVYYSDNNTITGNTINNNSDNGIHMRTATNNQISENTLNANDQGIHLSLSSNNNTLINNTINDSSDVGFYILSSINNTVAENTLYNNSAYGMYIVSSSHYNTLSNNNINGGDTAGINMDSSTYNTLSGNEVNGDSYGIRLIAAMNSTLTNNNATSDSGTGIYLSYSSNSTLTSNNASDNSGTGIYLSGSVNCVLTDNIVRDNGFYGINMQTDSNNNTLTYNTVSNNSNYGLRLQDSDYCTLADNIVSNNSQSGILLFMSNHNELTNNTVFENTNSGIHLSNSANCTLLDNQVNNSDEYNTGYRYLYLGTSPDNVVTSLLVNDGMAELGFTSNSSYSSIGWASELEYPHPTGKTGINGNYWITTPINMDAEFFYNDTDMNSTTEADIELYVKPLSSSEWNEVAGSSLDTDNNSVSATLTMSGYYALVVSDGSSSGDDDDSPGDSSSGSSTTRSSSSSSSRTSVSPGQDSSIVTSTVTSVKRIISGSEIDYEFSGSDTPVLGVSFDAKDDEGLVVAKVEVLSEAPSGVSQHSSKAYQMMSINVGSEGTISSGNADNIQIRFKVSKGWIEQNNIDITTIRMTRYHDDQWNDLPTYQESEDGEYIYLYAETPGFSIFGVVGDEITASSDQVPASASITEEVAEPVAEKETKDTPGFTALAGVVFVSLVVLTRKNKNLRER